MKCLFAELQEVTPTYLVDTSNFYSRYCFELSSNRWFSRFQVKRERNTLRINVVKRKNTAQDTMCFFVAGNWIL